MEKLTLDQITEKVLAKKTEEDKINRNYSKEIRKKANELATVFGKKE
jgi:hypothetical protein